MGDAGHDGSCDIYAQTSSLRGAPTICMHTCQPVSTDVRASRAATALAEAGFGVTIVDIEHDHTRPRQEDLVIALATPGASLGPQNSGSVRVKHIFMPARFTRYYVPMHSSPWLLFKALRVLCGLIELVKTPAEVYHASDLMALPASYVAARLRRKPLIFESYELPLVQPQIVSRRLLYVCCTLALRRSLRQCSGVITVSPPVASEIQHRYGGPAPVVIRNIPPYQPTRQSKRLHNHLGLSSETRIALYQGGLKAERGLGVLVRAARFLDPGIVIVLMGRGDGQPELESAIAQAGVSGLVRIIPPVPYAELQEWTASADIGLIIFQPRSPSISMCLPNKLFEYAMAGLPVLSSPLEAVAEVLSGYDIGHVVESLDPEAIARAISAMVADGPGLARMRRNALAACAGELRWESEKRKLIDFYRDILRSDTDALHWSMLAGAHNQ